MTKKEKKISNFKNAKRVLIAGSADIQRVIQEYYKYYTHPFDNLE